MLEEIKTKVLKERIEARTKPYLSTLHDYIIYIKEQVDSGQVDSEYLFNILRDIGYLDMMGAELPKQLIEDIRKLFTLNVSLIGKRAPDFIDFEDLSDEVESYIWQIKNLPLPPRLNNITEEEGWEDMYRGARKRGLGLILAGLDITAIILGYELVLDGNLESIKWNDCWTDFDKESEKYISKLSENKVSFYHFSDNILSHLTKFFRMPECLFRNMLLEIVKPRESYAQERYYRQIISPQEAKEIYFKTNLKFEKYSSTAQVYFYETALAQQILKAFILKACFAKEKHAYTSSNNWQILTTIDEGFDCEVPMISAGNKNYSVHMLDTPESKVSGWGIRKDRIKSFLSNDCHDFQGALFCSWKEYPTSEILVRFENHMEKNRLKELMGKKKEILVNFIELSLDEVYKFDKREKFLQEAAEAVMGLEKQPDWMREFLKKLLFAPGNGLDKIATALRKIPGIHEPGFTWALTPARVQADEEQDNYYIPVKSLENTTFLDPDPDSIFSNRSVSEAVDRGFAEEWQYIYLFVDTKANVIDEVHGPMEISGEGETIPDIPADAEYVWFFIGPSQTVNEIKTEYNKNKTLKITKQEKLYWIIYGPEK